MASKTITISSPNSWVAGQAVVSSTSNGSEKNSSNITITLQGRRTDGGTSYNDIASNFYIKINGTTVATDTNGCRISGTSWQNILVYSGTINHNNDGTKSITITVGGQITETTFKFYEKSETFTLDSIPRYGTITKFENMAVGPDRAIFNWATDCACSEVEYKIGSGSWIATSTSPPLTVRSLVPGTSYSITIRVKRQDSGLWTESSAIQITTKPIATLVDASGFSFNIGNDLVFLIKDASQNDSILKIYYRTSQGGWELCPAPFNEIMVSSGTSQILLSLSTIKSQLYSYCPTRQKLSLKITFGAIIDGEEFISEYIGTAHVTNSNPIFMGFECENIDPLSREVLGEHNKIYVPQGHGLIRLSINSVNKAIAQNYATMSYYFITVTNPNGSMIAAKMIEHTDDNINLDLEGLNLTVTGEYKIDILARDSRANASETVTRSFYVIDYHAPQTTIHVSRLNGFDNEVLLELTSVYSRLMLNSVVYNEITSIQYRTQSVQDMVWSSYVELTGDLSIAGNDATITISRDKNNILTSLSAEYEHNIEFVIKDKLGSYTYPVISLDQGVPNIAESDDGYFTIGMLPDWNSGAKLQVATDIMATDKDGNRKLILEEIKAVQDGLTEAGGALGGYLPLTGGNITGTLSIQGREYGVNKILWTGVAYLQSNQTVTLSEAISEQPNGIVLVFVDYTSSTGTVGTQGYWCIFIPKQAVIDFNARFWAFSNTLWHSHSRTVMKCFYLSNTQLTGHDYSISSTAPLSSNSQVLVRVYGV